MELQLKVVESRKPKGVFAVHVTRTYVHVYTPCM